VLVEGGYYEGLDEHAILVGWHNTVGVNPGPVTTGITLRNLTARTYQAGTHVEFADAVLIGTTVLDCMVDGLTVLECYRSALVLFDNSSECHGTEVKNSYLVGGLGSTTLSRGNLSLYP